MFPPYGIYIYTTHRYTPKSQWKPKRWSHGRFLFVRWQGRQAPLIVSPMAGAEPLEELPGLSLSSSLALAQQVGLVPGSTAAWTTDAVMVVPWFREKLGSQVPLQVENLQIPLIVLLFRFLVAFAHSSFSRLCCLCTPIPKPPHP